MFKSLFFILMSLTFVGPAKSEALDDFLQDATFSGSVDKNGTYDLTIKFPIFNGMTPKESLHLLLENEIAIKAADSFVSEIDVDLKKEKKVITSTIKIYHIYPDQVQLTCGTEKSKDGLVSNCTMTDIDYMTKKFVQYIDSYNCTESGCVIKSKATVAKKIWGVSKVDLAIIFAEKTIMRNLTLGFLLNKTNKAPASTDFKALGKHFKSSSTFKDEIDNLDEKYPKLITNVEEGTCPKFKFSFSHGKREVNCL